MNYTFKETHNVYIRSMGKLLRITAIAVGDDAANAYMETHDSAAMIAECGPFIFMADKYDPGTKINNMSETE